MDVDAYRQAINNSTFLNEQQDIGKAVSDWTGNYNKKHALLHDYFIRHLLTFCCYSHN